MYSLTLVPNGVNGGLIISYHIIYLRSKDPYRITNPSGYENSHICL